MIDRLSTCQFPLALRVAQAFLAAAVRLRASSASALALRASLVRLVAQAFLAAAVVLIGSSFLIICVSHYGALKCALSSAELGNRCWDLTNLSLRYKMINTF